MKPQVYAFRIVLSRTVFVLGNIKIAGREMRPVSGYKAFSSG